MTLEWKPGPPPKVAGKEWIVELENGQVHRVVFYNTLYFMVLCKFGAQQLWSSSDIIRHMPYEPIPEPVKPFRRFSCSCGDRRGMGSYNSNGDVPYRFQVHWPGKAACDVYQNIAELESRNIKIEWIDDDS